MDEETDVDEGEPSDGKPTEVEAVENMLPENTGFKINSSFSIKKQNQKFPRTVNNEATLR